MPTPRNTRSYPQLFGELLKTQDDQLPLYLEFASESDAKTFRLKWYGYRRAADGETEGRDDNISLTIRRDLTRTALYELIVRTNPFTGVSMVVMQLRGGPALQETLQRALAQRRPSSVAAAPVVGSDLEFDKAMSEHRKIQEKLHGEQASLLNENPTDVLRQLFPTKAQAPLVEATPQPQAQLEEAERQRAVETGLMKPEDAIKAEWEEVPPKGNNA